MGQRTTSGRLRQFSTMQLRKSTLVFLCVATLLVAAAPAAVATSPPAPLWANQFAFVSSVQDGNGNVYGSSQFYYDWSIPAVAQVGLWRYSSGSGRGGRRRRRLCVCVCVPH